LAKWSLKSIAKELVIGLGVVFVLSNAISYLRSPKLSSLSLPEVEVELLDEKKYQIKKGKPLLIHFWTTWCPACKLEAPNIDLVSKSYDVLTVVINATSDKEIKSYMRKGKFSFKVLNDKEGTWSKQFKIEAYPTTFIYDSKGNLRFTEVGYTTTAGLLARLKLIE